MAPKGELSRRFTTLKDDTLLVPNRSRPPIPLHLPKQPFRRPPTEEIQRLSLTDLFQDSTADYPRSSRCYQSPCDAVDSDGQWSQQVTDAVNGYMRPANAVRGWNIAGRDPNDKQYNTITETDWNMLQFKKKEKKEKK